MCSPVGLNGTTSNLRRLKPLRMLSGRASEIALAERLILLKQAQDLGEDLFSSHSERFEYDDDDDDFTTGAVSTTSPYFAIPDTFRPLRDANSREINQPQREQAANMRNDCVVALAHYPKFANEAGSSGHAHPESPQQTIHIATLLSNNVLADSHKMVCERPQPSSTMGKLESCCQSKDQTCGLPVRERVEFWRRKQLDWTEKVSEHPLSDSDTDSDDEASSSSTESDSSGPLTEPDDVPRKPEHASNFISDMAPPRVVATRASSTTPLQPLHPYTLSSGCAFIHPSLAKGYAYPVDNATKSLRMELHTATQPTPRSAALRRPGFGAPSNLERANAVTERAPGRTAASAT